MISALRTRVARTIREQHLLLPGSTVIVACSGGADSCALLDILLHLPSLDLHLMVAHLNHGLRGDESDSDERFVQELARHYGLPFESRHCDVSAEAQNLGLNLEDAGRRARIRFLDQVRQHHGAATVALAHHRDDQAETVLMRLLRGAGSTGLAGMSHRNGRGYIRPLLDISRHEIELYMQQRGLDYREDSSNRNTSFLRNRIRHELLPLLEQYNPAIRRSLADSAALLADENSYLEHQAHSLLAATCSISSTSITCPLTDLNQHPIALVRRVYLQALEQLAGTRHSFSRAHITALELLTTSPQPSGTLNLPHDITAQREYGILYLHRHLQSHDSPPEIIHIPGCGSYKLPHGSRLEVSACNIQQTGSPASVCIDLERMPFPWLMRAFQSGDRIKPVGMQGTKKVKELFIDKKVPHSQRRTWPLLFCNDTLMWVCGMRASRLAIAGDESKTIVRVDIHEDIRRKP